jgi:hypothetical protein
VTRERRPMNRDLWKGLVNCGSGLVNRDFWKVTEKS